MQRILYNQITVIIFTIITISICISLYLSAHQLGSSTQRVSDLEKQVKQQQDDVVQLQNSLEKSKQPFAKEKIMRDQLLLQQPGEYVVQLPEISRPSSTTIGTSNILASDNSQLTPWEAWKQVLFSDQIVLK
jgi:hypothetical protein